MSADSSRSINSTPARSPRNGLPRPRMWGRVPPWGRPPPLGTIWRVEQIRTRTNADNGRKNADKGRGRTRMTAGRTRQKQTEVCSAEKALVSGSTHGSIRALFRVHPRPQAFPPDPTTSMSQALAAAISRDTPGSIRALSVFIRGEAVRKTPRSSRNSAAWDGAESPHGNLRAESAIRGT